MDLMILGVEGVEGDGFWIHLPEDLPLGASEKGHDLMSLCSMHFLSSASSYHRDSK